LQKQQVLKANPKADLVILEMDEKSNQKQSGLIQDNSIV